MVKPALASMRSLGLRLAVVTDAPRNKAWQRLIITGLEKEFELVITHDDTMQRKPHPSPFRLALARLSLEPSECLFVGDNPERDIAGAKEVGLLTCLAAYGAWNRKAEPKADFELMRFEDIVPLVKRLRQGQQRLP